MLTKQKSFATLIKEADQAFSEYIRLRFADAGSGMVKCACGCGAFKHWRQMQCSHWVNRDNLATRHDEYNALPATQECNYYDPEHAKKIELRLRKIFGNRIIDEVSKKGHSQMKFTRPELEEIRDQYKAKVLELKKRKHL